MGTVTASPMVGSASLLGHPLSATIISTPMTGQARLLGHSVSSSPFVRRPENDRMVNAGILLATASLTSHLLSVTIVSTPLTANADLLGTVRPGVVVTMTPLTANASLQGESWIEFFKKNWVAWSKIGVASFVSDLVNDAGQRAMGWQGWVYQVKPLGKNTIVYGQGGVTLMYPVMEPAPTFGFEDLSLYGLLAKELVAGTDKIHFYVNNKGKLCMLTEKGIQVLGYEEFLLPLKQAGARPVMFYDEVEATLYVCNGKTGYVFADQNKGGGPINLTAGGGPINLVGMMSDLDSTMVACGTTPSSGVASFKTDVLAFGSRDIKIIQGVRISSITQSTLQCRILYREDSSLDMTATAWSTLNDQGEAFFAVSAVEFQIEVRQTSELALVIDDLVIDVLVPDDVAIASSGGTQ